MTKREIIKDIESRVIRIIDVLSIPERKKFEVGINYYEVQAIALNNSKAEDRTIRFYVVDENTKEEEAYYIDNIGARVSLEYETMLFISKLPFEKVTVDKVYKNEEFVTATAYAKQSDGTVKIERIILYKDKTNTPVYRKIV